MDDIQHPNDLPPLTIEQIRDLAATIRYCFWGAALPGRFHRTPTDVS